MRWWEWGAVISLLLPQIWATNTIASILRAVLNGNKISCLLIALLSSGNRDSRRSDDSHCTTPHYLLIHQYSLRWWLSLWLGVEWWLRVVLCESPIMLTGVILLYMIHGFQEVGGLNLLFIPIQTYKYIRIKWSHYSSHLLSFYGTVAPFNIPSPQNPFIYLNIG